jgi:hypothetical protein
LPLLTPIGRNAAPEQIMSLGDNRGTLPAVDVFQASLATWEALAGVQVAGLDNPETRKELVLRRIAQLSKLKTQVNVMDN